MELKKGMKVKCCGEMGRGKKVTGGSVGECGEVELMNSGGEDGNWSSSDRPVLN